MSSHHGPPSHAAPPSRSFAIEQHPRELDAQPLVLSFNCTCWQNRKARIYISSPQFDAAADQNFRKSVENCGTQLVLATPPPGALAPLHPLPHVTLPSGTKVSLFTDNGQSPFHCEFQVWKQSKDGRLSLYLDTLPPLPIEIERDELGNQGIEHQGSSGQEKEEQTTAPSGPPNATPSVLSSASATSVLGGLVGAVVSSGGSPLSSSGPSPLPPSPLESPTLVERSLRSRVAYSERPSRLLSRPIPKEDSIRMAKVALCNDRVYCTIDCMKGLKVQSLTLVCIFRINHQFFVSDFTHFPPPSSLKRKERSGSARPKRSAPYRKKFTGHYSDEGEYDFEDELDAEDPPSVQMAESVRSATSHQRGPSGGMAFHTISGLKGGVSTHSGNVTRRANTRHSDLPSAGDSGFATHAGGTHLVSALPSLARAIPSLSNHDLHHPSDDSSFERILALGAMGGEMTRNTGFASGSAPGPIPRTAHSLAPLHARSASLNTGPSSLPIGQDAWNLLAEHLGPGSVSSRAMTELASAAHVQSRLTYKPLIVSRNELSQWCLSITSGPWPKSCVPSILSILGLQCFVGNMDDASAFDLLSSRLAPQALGTFLLRLGKETPWIELYGVFRSQSGSPLTGYCASIRFEHTTSHPHSHPSQVSAVPNKATSSSSSSAPASSSSGSATGQVTFWLDTETNAEDSRCTSLADLVRYIATVTLWHAFDRDFRPPPVSSTSASASASHSSSSMFSSSAVYSLLPSTSSQQAHENPWQSWNTPQNLTAAFSSPFPMTAHYPYHMISVPHAPTGDIHGLPHEEPLHPGPTSLVSPTLHPTDLVSPMGSTIGTAGMMQPSTSYNGESAFFHRHS